MAYKPKYAKKRTRQSYSSPLFLVLTILIVPVSMLLSALLLRHMFFYAARPKPAGQATVGNMAIMQDFDSYMESQYAGAQAGLTSVGKPTEPTEPTLGPYKPIYTLDDSTQIAPEPNQALFGTVSSPAEMAEVLEKAAYILDGQSTYFTTETQIMEGSTITYYLDESIFAVTWKEGHNNTAYTFSEVKIGHASQIRRHLSDGAYGSGKLYLPTEMAATVNAVVASSGDFYANRPTLGVMVYEGNIYRSVEDSFTETCFIDRNGDLIFSHMKELKNTSNAKVFIQENDILFSVAFGPILVENYEVREMPSVYSVGEIHDTYARSALCQMDKLHYLVAVANYDPPMTSTVTVADFQTVIAATGCKMAYCLDGGQTATIVMNDQLMNRPAKGEQRRISDIIYFATAVPEGG